MPQKFYVLLLLLLLLYRDNLNLSCMTLYKISSFYSSLWNTCVFPRNDLFRMQMCIMVSHF